MKNVGKVTNLFISVQGSSSRVEKDVFDLDPKGILEDKYYDKNIQRSVLITSEASYTLAKIPLSSLSNTGRFLSILER